VAQAEDAPRRCAPPLRCGLRGVCYQRLRAVVPRNRLPVRSALRPPYVVRLARAYGRRAGLHHSRRRPGRSVHRPNSRRVRTVSAAAIPGAQQGGLLAIEPPPRSGTRRRHNVGCADDDRAGPTPWDSPEPQQAHSRMVPPQPARGAQGREPYGCHTFLRGPQAVPPKGRSGLGDSAVAALVHGGVPGTARWRRACRTGTPPCAPFGCCAPAGRTRHECCLALHIGCRLPLAAARPPRPLFIFVQGAMVAET
jgi:hypothetical protein